MKNQELIDHLTGIVVVVEQLVVGLAKDEPNSPEPPEAEEGYEIIPVGDKRGEGYRCKCKYTDDGDWLNGDCPNQIVSADDGNWCERPFTGQAYKDKYLPPGTLFELDYTGSTADKINPCFVRNNDITDVKGNIVSDRIKRFSAKTVKIIIKGK